VLGAVLAIAMARSSGAGRTHRVLQSAAWIAAGALLVVIPDRRVLLTVAYAPIVLFRSRFALTLTGSSRHPTGATLVFRERSLPWPVANQFVLFAGGALWAGAALASTAADDTTPHWTTPEAAAAWGRPAGAVAVAIPLVFAATRWAWAAGVPLGINEPFFEEGQESGLWRVGGALATVAAGGALLTLGLTHGWGEAFPRWTLALAGRRVPPAVAIVPAAAASIVVTSAGLAYVRTFIRGATPDEGWAVVLPELLWPAWGVALGAATLAYYYRTRVVTSPQGHARLANPARVDRSPGAVWPARHSGMPPSDL
jgi:hypothetical protein